MENGQLLLNLETLKHFRTNINEVTETVREFETKRIEEGKKIWLRNYPPTETYSIIRAATVIEYIKSKGKFNLVFVEEDMYGNTVRRCGLSSLDGYPKGIKQELLEESADLIFHFLIMLERADVSFDEVLLVLKKRMKND